MTKYREEMKFLVPEYEFDILESRLKNVMEYDKNQVGDSYRIRSLYFDDYYDSAFYENESGVVDRKKFRIRVYENPKVFIRLEIKYKYRGKTRKEACTINQKIYSDILNNTLEYNSDLDKPLRMLYLENRLYRLIPKIIVEYERTVFIEKLGNVRVTFDRNISYSENLNEFLEDRIDLIPVLPKTQNVLEVKYDGFIPDYIAQLLELSTLEQTPFSKYYLSRLGANGETEYDHKID